MFVVVLTILVNSSSHKKCVSKNAKFNLLLLIYILINRVKTCTTIHLRLNYIDVSKVVILLMTDLIKYMFQIKQKI